MGKKRTIWKKKLFDDASIRSMIFIYFTITALAASVLISLSLYQRMSRQVTEVVQEESQNLIAQVGRSVESYLRTIMKLSDSLYYGTIKNADLSSQSLGSEFTLLYDNNKDNVENIALFSEDGALLEAVPAARTSTSRATATTRKRSSRLSKSLTTSMIRKLMTKSRSFALWISAAMLSLS